MSRSLAVLVAGLALGCGDPGFYTPPPSSTTIEDRAPAAERDDPRAVERLSQVTGVELVGFGETLVYEIGLRFSNGCGRNPRIYVMSESADRSVLQIRHEVIEGPCTQALVETSVTYRRPPPNTGTVLEINGRSYGPF